ncbi:collagen alpha-1(I) chain-like [Trichoplusia ni]|uniref:Collagen alpha-1(I) chain-like n=1 Tax=Trichoplusia ni TaxID=7111 RepID=A0A7E5VTP3_TRINI|nr:collagen alpha-1(I) chain-like [Trichoplusia ni]
MMELTCAFILIFASLVSATPYGYGVKGGASAKAESSASAGAFGGVGDVPALPLGVGYSGSFSKSSASSSSSSSASSSSSSSSFSYSGSGAPSALGFGANHGAQGNVGCASGNCQNAGPHGIHGSSANAAAVAGASAGAISGTGCQGEGKGCDLDSKKCPTGRCSPKIVTGLPSTDSDETKCPGGNCGYDTENSASPDNDIRVVPDGSGSTYNSGDKTAPEYNKDGSACNYGNCGANASGKQPSSNTPSTHLETPKLGSKCNSGNCESTPDKTGQDTPPSSYNVPIHGTYDSEGGQKPACDGVKCENQPKRGYSSSQTNSLSTNYLKPQLSTDHYDTNGQSSADKQNPKNCGGSNCAGEPGQNLGSPSTSKPDNGNYGNHPADSPLHSNGCKTLNCSPYPTIPGASYVTPGLIGAGPTHNLNPSDNKLPAYTGGFGGPAGLFKPNENNVGAIPSGYPSHSHPSSSPHVPSYGSSSVGCNGPNCADNSLTSPGKPAQPSFGVNQPAEVSHPSEKLPPYTGGFGGPPGMLKPNDYNIHTSVPNNPNYAHPTSTSYNKQPSSSNYPAAGCNTPNCDGHYPTPAAGAPFHPSTAPGQFATTKPTAGYNSPNEKLPAYTGGFGAPSGVLKPSQYFTPTAGTGSGSYNSPSISGHGAGCNTPNCYPVTGTTGATGNAQPDVTSANKPYSGYPTGAPSYSGGYNKPSVEITPPAVSPSYTNNQSPPSPGSYTTGCKTGNCATYPTSSAAADANAQAGAFGKPSSEPSTGKLPQYTGSFGGPSGTLKPNENVYHTPTSSIPSSSCKTPNCGSTPPLTSDIHAGSHGNVKPSELPPYTGGFGGASGFLRPNEYTKPSGHPAPYDTHKPLAPNDAGKPGVACTSGACNTLGSQGSAAHNDAQGHNSVHGAQATASASDDTKSIPYTGGFGGPPGVLKPYDNGEIPSPKGNGQHPGSSTGGNYNSPSSNVHLPHKTNDDSTNGPAGTAGQSGEHPAGSQAGSAAGSYSGAAAGAAAGGLYNKPGSNYNGAGNVKGGSPCGGGCGGDGLHGGKSLAGAAAAAKSQASAGAYGGSFASSSASAHASAGAYTKGGYGKR